jgi:hypothetical protein
MKRLDVHGHFITSLGTRLLGAYSDGGPALRRSDKRRRKAQRLARRKNRRAR